MNNKIVWKDNVELFAKCVQESGGYIESVEEFYTDPDGDVLVMVYYTELTIEKRKEYEDKRIGRYKLYDD